MVRYLWVKLLIVSISVLFPLPGFGQGKQIYPLRPVRFIVPWPPGGGTDLVARIIGQRFSDELGQPFIIDNRGGAAGTVGANTAAKAAADGYTLLLATGSYAISASYYRKLPFNPIDDFDAVGLVVSGPLVLVAHPSLPANSIKELIALARTKPGELNFASSGSGGITHLAGELFLSMSGIRTTHVPYKGSGPARTALLSGEVQLLVAPLGPALPDIQSGKVKALAVCSARRSSLLPLLPTIAESGTPGYEADTWYGLLVPRGTPTAIIDILNKEILKALKNPRVVEQLTAFGLEPAGTTPEQFKNYLKSEITKWAKILKSAGVREN